MIKTYQEGDYVATHEHPAWRDHANFIIRFCLGEKDGRNEWEQLWARRIGDNRFSICCIPFFAFDLALGDEVETDAENVVARVVNPSGHYTFRVWFGESNEPGIRDELLDKVRRLDCGIEWSSENLLAVDAANSDVAQDMANFLNENEKLGKLVYEAGRTT